MLQGAGVIYVVDGARPLIDMHLAEMELLRLTGAPRLAVINRTGSDAHVEAWRRRLGQHFNAVREFDAMRAGFAERIELLETLAGIEQATAEPSLPFFIEWGHGTPLPGRAPVTHRAGAVQIATLRLDGDADRLAAWLGAHRLPVTVRPGTPAVASIVLTGPAGEIVLDNDRM